MSSPNDYGSAARSLAINEPSLPSTPTLERAQPSWTRRRQSTTSAAGGGNNRFQKSQSAVADTIQLARTYIRLLYSLWKKLPLWQKIALSVAGIIIDIGIILFLVYNETILEWLHPHAVSWSEKSGGWLLIWFIIFLCGFPPVLGYSWMLTVAGFIYGVPRGWLIAATANVAGSSAAFLVCRRFFSAWVERKFAQQTQFQALSLVLKHDGIKLLTMIRLCPLPYSASNGALSTFPTLSLKAFATATALATPKLLIHVFIGSRFGAIGKDGRQMDTTSKVINYASIAAGGILGAVTGVMIYRRTKARARELELEEQAKLEEREAALAHPDAFEDGDAEEIDDEAVNSVLDQLGDDIDFLESTADAEPYRDDASDEGERIGLRKQRPADKR